MRARFGIVRPGLVFASAAGVAIGVVLAGSVVFASTHAPRTDAAAAETPPASVPADFTIGGQPLDRIGLSYIPKGFKSSGNEVQDYNSGAHMNSQKFTGEGQSFDIEALRRPEPLDLGSDLGFPTDVTKVTISGQEAFLLTASDGSAEVAVVEWQQGPTIVKVIGTNIPVDELLRIAEGVSVTSDAA